MAFVLRASVLLLVILPRAMSEISSCAPGMERFHERRWSDAVTAFEQCELQNPGKTDALSYAGKSLVNLGKFPDASIALETYAKSHPQSDDAAYLLAYISFRQDKPRESLQLFTRGSKVETAVRRRSDDRRFGLRSS